jgi:hypothetical protein
MRGTRSRGRGTTKVQLQPADRIRAPTNLYFFFEVGDKSARIGSSFSGVAGIPG